MKHLVLYDGECGLCDRAVQWILKNDKKVQFAFAPLQGEVAKKEAAQLLEQEPDLDSLVLVENYEGSERRLLVRAKAVLRIAWLIGGAWALIGWLHVLPGWVLDWLYNLVARNRHRLFRKEPFCKIPTPEERQRFFD